MRRLNLGRDRDFTRTKDPIEKPLDLCKILKGHEGELFYFDEIEKTVVLKEIKEIHDKKYLIVSHCYDRYAIRNDGKWFDEGNVSLFPSKDQRDWIKWDKENNPKIPKIWSELIKYKKGLRRYLWCGQTEKGCYTINDPDPIERAAKALLQIYQLIELGYGGNVTNEDWIDRDIPKYAIVVNPDLSFEVKMYSFTESRIVFYDSAKAEEFLSYPENVQLLKDYFMIFNLKENEENLDS